MREYVWVSESELYPPRKELILNPKYLTEIKEFESIVSSNTELQATLNKIRSGSFELEDKIIVTGHRGGGGLLLFIGRPKDYKTILELRDEKTDRLPLSIDIPAGVMTGSPGSKKSMAIPTIISEMYEIIPVRTTENGNTVEIQLHKPQVDDRDVDLFLTTTELNTAAILILEKYFKNKNIVIYHRPDAIIGRWERNSYNVVENSSDGKSKYKINAFVTSEPEEGSLEIIGNVLIPDLDEKPLFMDLGLKNVKIRGGFVYLDGEHLTKGNPSLNDVGIEGGSFELLNRHIILIYRDGTASVYRDGKVLDYGIDLDTLVEKYEIAKAIKGGITTGATSKVWKLGEEGRRGNNAVFNLDGKEVRYSLKPLAELTEILKSYNIKA
jgi:hypothetical protein